MSKTKLTIEEKEELISQMGMGELQMRRALINGAIRLCMQENDPNNQIPNYRAQLQRIDNAIKNLKGKNGKLAVQINAKPGSISGRGIGLRSK